MTALRERYMTDEEDAERTDQHAMLTSCRALVREIMSREGMRKVDVVRAGVPPASLNFFLDLHGNVSIRAFSRIIRAMGYRVTITAKKVRDLG